MAIQRRRRRKLRLGDRDYVWHVDQWLLRIASIDKTFGVSIFIAWVPWEPMPDGFLPVLVTGPVFPGLDGRKDVWVRCDRFGPDDLGPNPGSVRNLVEWSLSPKEAVEILGSHPGVNG